jgi:hypothetical protein
MNAGGSRFKLDASGGCEDLAVNLAHTRGRGQILSSYLLLRMTIPSKKNEIGGRPVIRRRALNRTQA